MGLLLYKSNEMFSSTDLIRKSKMIFNKIIDKDIEKAIIMRDGKPGFLLMDFAKYESIMAEFEKLKNSIDSKTTNLKKQNKSKKEKKKKKEILIEKVEKEKIELKEEDRKERAIKSSHITPPRPKKIDEVVSVEDEDIVVEDYSEPTEEEEIKKALESIKSMNFDDKMKAVAEQKIKNKILQARANREKLKEQEEKDNQYDLKEELEVQIQIKEDNKKKERELKEFWD
ncbi:MAG: hypothetical protein U9R16_03125 [Campylobacterota bacterium]|nr:hypothetical protein [Campylobacterota bacterium]